MVHASNETGMIILSREELESIRKSEYDRGFEEGKSKAIAEATPKSRARIKNGNTEAEFRAAVVENENAE